MVSRNLRSQFIPLNLILLSTSNTAPVDYTNVSTHFDLYPKNVVNICSCPGGCSFGANSHSEISSGSHSHTVNAPTTHSHTQTLAAGVPSVAAGKPLTNTTGTPVGHTHTVSTGPSSNAYTIPTSASSHTHSSVNSEPAFKTINFIKRTTARLSLRRNGIPLDLFVLHQGINNSIPAQLTLDTAHFNNYLKHILNNCATPGGTGGAATHQHASSGTHQHVATAGTHPHTGATSGGAPGITIHAGTPPDPTGTNVIGAPHTHAVGSIAIGPTTNYCPLGSSGGHAHASVNQEPRSHTLALLKSTILNMRRKGLFPNAIAYWESALSIIPAEYQVPDGTNGTPDIRDRYVKIIPDAGTDPGTQAGTNNHTHTAITHGHSAAAHTHTITGTSATSSVPNIRILRGEFDPTPVNVSGLGHSHGSGSVNPITTGTIVNETAHTHTASGNDPLSLRVALVQKIA